MVELPTERKAPTLPQTSPNPGRAILKPARLGRRQATGRSRLCRHYIPAQAKSEIWCCENRLLSAINRQKVKLPISLKPALKLGLAQDSPFRAQGDAGAITTRSNYNPAQAKSDIWRSENRLLSTNQSTERKSPILAQTSPETRAGSRQPVQGAGRRGS